MKRTLSLLLLALCLGLSACAGTETPESAPAQESASQEEPSSGSAGPVHTAPAIEAITYTPPEGWLQDESDPATYYSPNYANDMAYVSFSTSDMSTDFYLWGEEDTQDTITAYDAELTAAYSQALGTQLEEADLTVDCDTCQYLEIAGLDALHLNLNVTVQEEAALNIQIYLLHGEPEYMFTFCQYGDRAWSDAFAQSMQQLQVTLG